MSRARTCAPRLGRVFFFLFIFCSDDETLVALASDSAWMAALALVRRAPGHSALTWGLHATLQATLTNLIFCPNSHSLLSWHYGHIG